MRLPNGMGSVIKLSGNRRKPYGARVTVGWKDGKQVRKYIGYYVSPIEAINALSAYNTNPHEIDSKNMTFSDVWEKWIKTDNYEQASKHSRHSWQTGYNNCKPLYPMPMNEIKVSHIEDLFEGKGRSSQVQIKNVCNKLFKYSLKYEWIEKNPVSQVEFRKDSKPKRTAVIFSEEEIKDVWEKAKTDEFYELILILLYTGMRVGELLELQQANIFDDYMIGGFKTDAGTNRIIPLHRKIRKFIRKRMDGSKYLLHDETGKPLEYIELKRPFSKRFENHNPHDTRHTFISRMHSAGANEVTLKIIVGHTMSDVTSAVYVHKEKDELLKAVHLLK